MGLKLVVFGLMDTLIFRGKVKEHEDLYAQVKEMLQIFKDRSINIVVLSKRHVAVNGETLNQEALKRRLEHMYEVDFDFRYAQDKATKELGDRVKDDYSLQTEEIIYIGNSEMDFRTAVNSKFLFLNACWHAQNSPYGFIFKTPKELINYLNVFCFKTHYWQFESDSPIRFRSMAICSTYYNEFEEYSQAAIDAAKKGISHKDFFLKQIVSSVYFSGLFHEFDYVTSYPGHNVGVGNKIMEEILTIMGKFYRQKYIPDLIIRHTEADKLQYTRKKYPPKKNFTKQISSIHLNRTPMRSATQKYRNFASTIKNKTLLVVDDFCTEGTSLEAARSYIENAGGKVIALSWLKFISKGFNHFKINKKFNSFIPNSFSEDDCSLETNIPYSTLKVDSKAHIEFGELFKDYCELF